MNNKQEQFLNYILKRVQDGKVDATRSKAYAVASGAIAHIYINLENRERKGIVSKAEYSEVQKEIIDTFTELKVKEVSKIKQMHYLFNKWRQDTHNENAVSTSKKMLKVLIGSKEKPFEEIIARGSKEAEILSHEQAGDVLLIANQGYYIAQDEESTVKKAVDHGSHGGNPERKELRPVLFVTGGNYPTANITEEITTVDIAPTLYELLNLSAPDFIDGKVINQIIDSESD